MPREYKRRKTKPKILEARYDKWNSYNTLVSKTEVKPDELVDGQNVQYVEDGKIQCPRDGQQYFGNSSGSKVTGLFPYYKSDGTKKLARISGTNLQEYDSGSQNWTNVSGNTYTTTLNTSGVMAYDKLYLQNGTDSLSYYNGSTITTFTAISAPTISSVTRTGTTGSYTFSYKVTAVTANGETTPSTADSSDLNQDELDSSNYMTISWGSVTNAIGYNVYGRKDGAWYFITYLEGNSSTSYADKGEITPNEAFTPPEGNSTGGQIGKYIEVYKDSLFVYGDPNNPSRLYYSGGGDKVEDFTIGGGGGFIDVSKNDGQLGTGLIQFKDILLVFKERSIYKFSFTTSGLPQIEQVNPSIGCVAPRSIVAVENDIFFAGEDGVYTIGNEAGFSFDVLRTNELSVKVRSIYQSIDPAYIQNIAAVYAKKNGQNLVIFSYTPSGQTTNSEAIVYDRQRLGWLPKWSNFNANCWAVYKGSDGVRHILYGDDSSGYVKEAFNGSDDFGSGINGYFEIKSESFKTGINRYKRLKDMDLVLRQPQGSITVSIITDGVTTEKTVPITTLSPSINWSHYTFTEFTFADSQGTGAITSQDDNLLKSEKNINTQARSFGLRFDNNSSASFTLLLASLTAKPRSPRYRLSTDLI